MVNHFSSLKVLSSAVLYEIVCLYLCSVVESCSGQGGYRGGSNSALLYTGGRNIDLNCPYICSYCCPEHCL